MRYSLSRAHCLLLIACSLLASCSTTKKNKSSERTRIDSTVIAHQQTHVLTKTDSIGVRTIQFIANKVTEIDWIRDTTFKDTIIYKQRIRVIENTQQNTQDNSALSKTDSSAHTSDVQTNVKKDVKKTEKHKEVKSSSIWWLWLIAAVMAYVIYRFGRKFLNL